MGTTLTGTTPQDTYDSLIKVGDNGPIGASAKTLSDGLGNDLPISVSTSAVAIGTLNVGYGTFGVYNASNSLLGIANSTSYAQLQQNGSDLYVNTNLGGAAGGNLIFRFGSGSTEHARITSAGNVGIGTSAPASKLHVQSGALQVSGNSIDTVISYSTVGIVGTTTAHDLQIIRNSAEICRVTANGLTFNGDTAAANALDDYEEGTFTPSISFGGGSTGITYFDRVGNYTKIGRQVTCTIYVAMTAIGSSTGAATLTGLPFTASGLNRGIATAASIRFDNITYTGTLSLLGGQSGNTLAFGQTTEAGVDSLLTNANFNGDSEMVITVTYFV